jgi:FKBP-type peptidyl-prolyl cis-trans isomerase
MKIKSLILYSVLLIGGGLGLQGCIDNDNPNARHEEEVKIIDQYIQANNVPDVLYDNVYGIRFVIQGTGNMPPAHGTDVVKGTYTGYILFDDGTTQQFDNGQINKKLSEIEPGALSYLASILFEGSTGTIISPSRYAYGASGNTALNVPANAIVIYGLTVTEVDRGNEWEDRLEVDTMAITNYIHTAGITGAIKHHSGFWYKVENPGTGAFARPYSIVNFDYELRLLLGSGPGNIIQNQSLTNQSVWALIDGLKLGFPLMQEGTEITFYIPSGLAYGDEESASIPKNSNLVFKIKLTDIVTQ